MIPSLAFSQSGPAKRAWKNYQDQEWEKAWELSSKALEKDTTDALAWFVRSKIYFTPSNARYQIDSADQYLQKSQRLVKQSDLKQQEDYSKEGLTEVTFTLHRIHIDSAAYQRALGYMTEQDFNDFLSRFPSAKEKPDAILLRDSLAYASAISEHTYEAYNRFMTRYPEARQVPEARARYEKLYFEIATADRRMESYLKFLQDNPTTPFRYDAELAIFNIMTAQGSADDFLRFLKNHPESSLVSRARNFLFHLSPNPATSGDFPGKFLTDSLRQSLALQGHWFPFTENEKYGFMNDRGEVMIPASLPNVFSDYLCTGLNTDFILSGDERLTDRQLNDLYPQQIDEVAHLGKGILKITNGNKTGAIHKAGYDILPTAFDDIQLTGSLLVISENNRKGLSTLSGKILLNPKFEDVLYENGLYFLESENGWQILTPATIRSLANNEQSGISSPVYDRFQFVNEGTHLWLKKGTIESLVDVSLAEIIPAASQRILLLPAAYVSQTENELLILRPDQMQRFRTGDPMLGYNDQWVVFKKEQGAGLFSLEDFRLSTLSDSVLLLGRTFAVTYFQGSRKLHSMSQDVYPLGQGVTLEHMKATDREWILLRDKRTITVINRRGQSIFSGQAERVTPLSDSLLVIEQYGKKELLTFQGDKPLKIRFDGIGNPENGLIPLLTGQRFGAYHLPSGTFLRPVSSKRIRPYNDFLFIAETDKMGMIDRDSKTVVDFSFDDIQHWNDTTCLVKQGGDWKFYRMGKGLMDMSPIKSIQPVRDVDGAHEIIVFMNDAFGVLSSVKNEIIPPTLDDIINIGTPLTPLYLTDKFVEEANLHVVVYFDEHGTVIRKQAMEENQFDDIYCDH
jgi:tetratricopeptide (TPR) repeat protein